MAGIAQFFTKIYRVKLKYLVENREKAFPWNADMQNMIGEQVGVTGVIRSPVAKNRQPEPG